MAPDALKTLVHLEEPSLVGTMKTPLAWTNLVHQRRRTLVAVAGIAFAITLIFMHWVSRDP